MKKDYVFRAASHYKSLFSLPSHKILQIVTVFCSIIGMTITLILWWIAHTRINNNKRKKELKGIELSIEKTQMEK